MRGGSEDDQRSWAHSLVLRRSSWHFRPSDIGVSERPWMSNHPRPLLLVALGTHIQLRLLQPSNLKYAQTAPEGMHSALDTHTAVGLHA